MLKFIFGILGFILLLPLGIVLVGLLITTLIGAYSYVVLQIAWPIAVVVGLIFLIKFIKRLLKK